MMTSISKILLWPVIGLTFFITYFGTGVFLISFCLSVILGFLAVRRRIKTPVIYPKRDFNYITIAVCVFLSWFISALVGIDIGAIEKWSEHLLMTVLAIFLYLNLRHISLPSRSNIVNYTLALSALFSLGIFIDHSFIAPQLSAFIHGAEVKQTFYASILAITSPFLLWACLQKNQWWGWAIYALQVAAIFVTGGRSGWIAFMVMVLAFLVLYPFSLSFNPIKTKLTIIVTAFLGAIIGLKTYASTVSTEQFSSRLAMSSEAGLGSGRLDIWEFSFQNFLEAPLFGIGLQNFRLLDFSNVDLTSTYHPHNIAVELLLETGLIGTILFSLFVIYFVADLYKNTYISVKKSILEYELLICAFCGFIAYGVASMTLTSFFHGWWFGYFLLLVIVIKALQFKLAKNH